MLDTLKEDLEILNSIMKIEKNTKGVKQFFWLYPFTNENLKGYYSSIDFKEKDVLCVTSSGDHALNALVLGAKNIHSFDINPLAKYYSELKIAAIQALTLEEFILFFYNKSYFDRKKYYLKKEIYLEKISKFLDKNVKLFWNYIFENYTSKDIYNSYLFVNDHLKLKGLVQANYYFNEKTFNELKNILKEKKIIYHDVNLKDLNKLNHKFDIVILSNIPTFLMDIYKKDVLEKFKELIETLKTEDNIVVLNYFYNNLISNNDETLGEIYNWSKVNQLFNDHEYEYKYFESAEFLDCSKRVRNRVYYKQDKVLISKKH